MATAGDEDFLRIALLLMKGGGLISKETLQREIRNSGESIDILLTRFKKRLKHQFHKKQIQKLFPDHGTTDIEEWDIQMITGILLTIFDGTLYDEEKDAIESIKYVRNEVYAHRPPTPMDHSDYDDIRNELEVAITALSSKFDKYTQAMFARTIKESTSWQLDSASVNTLLKGINDSEELLQDILRKQKLFSDEIKQTTKDQHEQTRKEAVEHKDMILNELRRIQNDEERSKEKISIVLGTMLNLTGDKDQSELVDEAEKIITRVINVGRKRAESAEYPLVLQAVRTMLGEIEKIPNVVVLPAKRKCIALEFQCLSYDGLLKLLLYLESKDYIDSLTNIANAVRDVQSVKNPYFLSSRLNPESLKEVFKKITESTESEYGRTVELPIKVTSLGGIANVCTLFDNDGATNSFNTVSEAISSHLGTKITLKPSFNVQQVKEALRNEGETCPDTTKRTGVKDEEKPLATEITDSDTEQVDAALGKGDNEGTNELFRSLIMIKVSDPPSTDSGFDDDFSNKTGTSMVSSSRSSETNDEAEAIETDLPLHQQEMSIGMSVNMQQLDDSGVRVSSIGPLVSVSGTHSKCFLTVGIKQRLLKTAITAETERNLKVLANNPEDDTLLVAVDDTGASSTELETGITVESTLGVPPDRKHLPDGTKVCKVGVSGLTEGIITGTGMIPGQESKSNTQSIMYVASLPGSQDTPFAENGDAGSAVFCQIGNKWYCIGILLGVQKNLNSDEKLYVVQYIDDVIDGIQKICGKHISLDHYTMGLQVSHLYDLS